jgi:hypothetical protein
MVVVSLRIYKAGTTVDIMMRLYALLRVECQLVGSNFYHGCGKSTHLQGRHNRTTASSLL